MASHALHGTGNDCKAQTGARSWMLAGRVGAEEDIEEVGKRLGRNAGTIVGQLQDSGTVRGQSAHAERASRCILGGIGDDVCNAAEEELAVEAAADLRREILCKGDALCASAVVDVCQYRGGCLGEVSFLDGCRVVVEIELREQEELRDEMGELLCLAVDRLKVAALALGCSRDAVEEPLNVSLNGCQRRPQIMADAGYELLARACLLT